MITEVTNCIKKGENKFELHFKEVDNGYYKGGSNIHIGKGDIIELKANPEGAGHFIYYKNIKVGKADFRSYGTTPSKED